jgi:NCS1 family nucleobase:cation symporter-1
MENTPVSHDPATSTGLWNEDLAPTSAAQRTWRWYHFAALWVGMVISIPAYMLSACHADIPPSIRLAESM